MRALLKAGVVLIALAALVASDQALRTMAVAKAADAGIVLLGTTSSGGGDGGEGDDGGDSQFALSGRAAHRSVG